MLTGLPAVSLEGPKAVGKTETAMRRAITTHRLDDPGQHELFIAAPERLIAGDPPVLIDEWQRLPASWDLVRRTVDADPSPARFILTGSASPPSAPTHSGAGRIVTVRMRPRSLAERNIETPTVSLADLLSGDRSELSGNTSVGLETYTEEITRSGIPAIRELSGRILRSQLDGYLDRIVEREFTEAGHNVRNVDTEALIGGVPTGPTIPRDGTLLGALFESLVTLSVQTYAQANEARVHHLRTRAGEHEIDLIIERRDGRIVALEVKLSATVDDDDTRHLRWLADTIGDDLLDAAVITTGKDAYRRLDGIGVVPAALLTA